MNSERPAGERHVPVLRDRCINLLAPAIERAIEERGRAVVVDATLGMGGTFGGHAAAFSAVAFGRY